MTETNTHRETGQRQRFGWVALAWIAAAVSACGADGHEELPTDGSRVEAKEPRQVLPATPAFFEAAQTGDRAAVEAALESGVEVDAADPQGNTALMLAAFNGHSELVRFLLEGGALVNHRDATGRTALMYASSGPFPDTVSLLLEHKADVNLTDNGEGWSAIMFAGGEGLAEVITVLLSNGADPARMDEDGDTALNFAQRNSHLEAAALLGAAMKK
jgi:ankyrin repeat protein